MYEFIFVKNGTTLSFLTKALHFKHGREKIVPLLVWLHNRSLVSKDLSQHNFFIDCDISIAYELPLSLERQVGKFACTNLGDCINFSLRRMRLRIPESAEAPFGGVKTNGYSM